MSYRSQNNLLTTVKTSAVVNLPILKSYSYRDKLARGVATHSRCSSRRRDMNHRFATLDGIDDIAPVKARSALRDASHQLIERGLLDAAQWCLELLSCVPHPQGPPLSTPRLGTDEFAHKFPVHSTPALNLESPSWANEEQVGEGAISWTSWENTSPSGQSRGMPSPARSMDPPTSPDEHLHVRISEPSQGIQKSMQYDDVYLLAKTFFDRENFQACIAHLEEQQDLSDKARFLLLYAKLLMYDMHPTKPNELLPPLAYADKSAIDGAHPVLVSLLQDLISPSDPFLLFLKGVILRKLHKRIEAMDCLISSLRAFPYNWSAWKELSRTLNQKNAEREQILDLLPSSFMSVFFLEYSQRQSTQIDLEHFERIDALLMHFPRSAYLLTCRAQALYLHQELEDAADTFQHALELQPYRLDGISEYSNTLYVLDREDTLAQLVQQFAHVSNSAEIWCMRGNFYNQRGEHFRAVESFKQALRLDQECVAAWILLGHEYLEVKNSHAAAEMYRRAIELNPHDYRPWHGLGHVYELNEAWSAAIDYYQQCAMIRPHDARMWASLGVCYDRLGRNAQAIECFKRHLTCPLTHLESVEAIAQIIELYEQGGDSVHATMYHCLLVQVVDRSMAQMDPALMSRFAFSYIIAARWEMGELNGRLYYSKEDKRLGRAAQASMPTGDMVKAHDYLQKVLLAGTEMTPVAEELLIKLGGRKERGYDDNTT